MNKSKNREQMINRIIFVTTLVFSVCIAEITLRTLTPFPINDSSNKISDTELGYRISSEFHEADANGFRNPPGTGYELIAIGDSHTYGNNVSSDDAWPALLAQSINRQVYNFGVGSYGIFAYHALLKNSPKPETKAAVIALYPRNDFEVSGSNCLILDKPSPFWKNEFKRLKMERPKFQAKESCSDRLVAKSISIGDWLERNTAIINALDAVFDQKSLSEDEARYEFPSGVLPLSAKRVDQSAESMNLENPYARSLLNNFSRMANDWAQSAPKTGVLIVPSRERVVYGYFARHNRLGELNLEFITKMNNQLAFEDYCEQILLAAKIPYRFALDEVVSAFENALNEGRNLYRADDDGHPLREGYIAYAVAAKKLLEEMQI
ncbi:MAG: hypothetical protein ACU85E_13935 [Gammaproteobacteria bacterium]